VLESPRWRVPSRCCPPRARRVRGHGLACRPSCWAPGPDASFSSPWACTCSGRWRPCPGRPGTAAALVWAYALQRLPALAASPEAPAPAHPQQAHPLYLFIALVPVPADPALLPRLGIQAASW
jgi:hypothetical protein